MLRTFAFSVALVFSVGLASSAEASSPYFFGNPSFGGTGGFFLQGNYYSLYGLGAIPVPPYYAIHPPVYYSHPVARPYGYSPFALPAGVQPSELLAVPEPLEVINPHVMPEDEQESGQKSRNRKTNTVAKRRAPQWIANPFVTPASTEDSTQLAEVVGSAGAR